MINSTSSILNISHLTDPSLRSIISFTTDIIIQDYQMFVTGQIEKKITLGN